MTPKPVEWAKVERCVSGAAFSYRCVVGRYEGARRSLDDANAEAAQINEALSPLLARAELLETAINHLRELRDCLMEEGVSVGVPGGRAYVASLYATDILTSYASLPKMPEQGKQKGEDNA